MGAFFNDRDLWHQFTMECRLLLKSLPKGCFVVNAGLWVYSIFAPLQYVQGYLWIIMLICSVALFSQMGCREHENSLTECFVTIKSSLVRQMAYSYLWAAVILFMLSMPVIIRCFTEQKFLCSCSYTAFSFFVPALACFLGEYSRSRRAFETVYLLICFLLLNMPSFLFQGYVVAVMVIVTAILMPITLMKRLHLWCFYSEKKWGDDEKEAVTLHEGIIKDSLQSCGIGYEITTYTYSSNLLSDIAEDGFFYDLLLLDIEMPDVTGMELAGKIKPFLPNTKVIFITSHMEYAIDAFELSIFRYVPKNDLEKRLKTAVADAARLIELEAGREYIIQAAGRMEKIPYKDIFYIQRDGGKNSAICSNAGTSKVRKSLQQVSRELDAPEFIFIDRGCIANIIQIMKVADGMAFLKNGEALPISRSHLQAVKQQINRFWGTHI